MRIFYWSKFKRQYKKLSYLWAEAARREEIFRRDPHDSRLRTHKLHGRWQGYWAFWIDYRYRIIFKFHDEGDVYFYEIGAHDIY